MGQSIKFKSAHGLYQCSPESMDVMIAKYLPTSPLDLCRLVTEMFPEIDWRDVSTVSGFLVILGECEDGRLEIERDREALTKKGNV